MTSIDYFILAGLVLSLGLGIWFKSLDSRLGAKIAAAFLFMLLAQYQNCSPADNGGFITAASSKCKTGQYVDIQGNCAGTVSGLTLTIDSPTGLQTLGMSGSLSVSGRCTLSLNPMITARLINSSNTQVTQASIACQPGGSGQYSIALSQGNQVVSSAGSYTLSVTAATNNGSTEVHRILTFTSGAAAPVINGPVPPTSVTYGNSISAQVLELAYLVPNGGPAQLSGTCDGADTFTLELHRKGLGPTSDPTDQAVTQTNCVGGSFSIFDNAVANGINGYDNWTYQVVAIDSSSVRTNSNPVTAFVRPLPKDINNDDIQRILIAMSNIFGVSSSYIPNASDNIFTNLSNFGNNPNYGLFQAACQMVSTYYTNHPTGAAATYYVCISLGMGYNSANNTCNNLAEFNPASNRIWDEVNAEVNQQGSLYYPPQKLVGDLNGKPIKALPATACP